MASPSEHAEQVALVQWANLMAGKRPELRLLFAVPNGGDRNPIVGMKLAAEGVKPGVPDLVLPVPSREFHGLFIEMKRTTGGRVSPEQKRWHEALKAQGYRVAVCKGFTEAAATVAAYLEM